MLMLILSSLILCFSRSDSAGFCYVCDNKECYVVTENELFVFICRTGFCRTSFHRDGTLRSKGCSDKFVREGCDDDYFCICTGDYCNNFNHTLVLPPTTSTTPTTTQTSSTTTTMVPTTTTKTTTEVKQIVCYSCHSPFCSNVVTGNCEYPNECCTRFHPNGVVVSKACWKNIINDTCNPNDGREPNTIICFCRDSYCNSFNHTLPPEFLITTSTTTKKTTEEIRMTTKEIYDPRKITVLQPITEKWPKIPFNKLVRSKKSYEPNHGSFEENKPASRSASVKEPLVLFLVAFSFVFLMFNHFRLFY